MKVKRCNENADRRTRTHWRTALSVMPRNSRNKRNLLSLQKPDDLSETPSVVSQASRHRGSDPKRGVNPREIVVDEMHRAGEPVILHLLGKSICQSGKSAHLHSHRQILPLHMACADAG